MGGDLHTHFEDNAISKFGLGCATGSVPVIVDMLQAAIEQDSSSSDGRPIQPWYYSDNGQDRHQTTMAKLLETRETSMRLSPLLLIVSAGKNFCTNRSSTII